MPILRPSDALERLLFCESLGDIFLDQILSGYFTSNNFPQIFDLIGRDRSTFACGCMKSLSNGSFSAGKNAVSPTDGVAAVSRSASACGRPCVSSHETKGEM